MKQAIGTHLRIASCNNQNSWCAHIITSVQYHCRFVKDSYYCLLLLLQCFRINILLFLCFYFVLLPCSLLRTNIEIFFYEPRIIGEYDCCLLGPTHQTLSLRLWHAITADSAIFWSFPLLQWYSLIEIDINVSQNELEFVAKILTRQNLARFWWDLL